MNSIPTDNFKEITEAVASIIAALAMWYVIVLINRIITLNIDKSSERNRD